jgi:hypothetical protein
VTDLPFGRVELGLASLLKDPLVVRAPQLLLESVEREIGRAARFVGARVRSEVGAAPAHVTVRFEASALAEDIHFESAYLMEFLCKLTAAALDHGLQCFDLVSFQVSEMNCDGCDVRHRSTSALSVAPE